MKNTIVKFPFGKLSLGLAVLAICIMGSSLVVEAQNARCFGPPEGATEVFPPGAGQLLAVTNLAPIQIRAFLNVQTVNGGPVVLTCETGGAQTPGTNPLRLNQNRPIYAFSCPATSDTVTLDCQAGAGGACTVCYVP